MKIGVIGIGQAGGRIADTLAYHSRWGKHPDIVTFALAINSAKADLMGLLAIPKRDRILIGQTLVRGQGAGLNRDIGRKATEQALHKIMRAVTEWFVERVDAFIVIAGLGGGTGSGGAPIIISRLKRTYAEPVYFIGILPAGFEGEWMHANAIQCLKETRGVSDSTLLFDNDLWAVGGRPLDRSYHAMNIQLVRPLSILFGAGEVGKSRVGMKVVDTSDIVNSLEMFSYIGYSETKTGKLSDILPLFNRLISPDQLDPIIKASATIRSAATEKLSGRCDIEKARKALMVIAGPPKYLTMVGFSHSRSWLEECIQTDEVRGGDLPIQGRGPIVGVVLLSGYDHIPRMAVDWI